MQLGLDLMAGWTLAANGEPLQASWPADVREGWEMYHRGRIAEAVMRRALPKPMSAAA